MEPGRKNRRYPGELKLQVVEAVLKRKLTLREAAAEYGVSSGKAVWYWVKVHRQEGPGALARDRRKDWKGRKAQPADRQDLQTADRAALIEELRRLRAENDYLKKRRALALEEEGRQGRKRPSSRG